MLDLRVTTARPLPAADRLADGGPFLERTGLPPAAPVVESLLRDLRATVVGYVGARRAEGVPIERVLPAVKGFVRVAELREGWCDPADALMGQVVRWAIAAYYDQPAP